MSEKPKTSLEIFIESLEIGEKELLLNYVKEQTYDSLSVQFDNLLGIQDEDQKSKGKRL